MRSFYIFAAAAILAASPARNIAGAPPLSRNVSARRAQNAGVPPVQDSQPQEPQDSQDKGLRPDNSLRKNLSGFAQITPTPYRGAQASHDGFRKLAAMGVKIVIDLRGDRKSERKFVNSLGMTYIPMGWECSFPEDKTFAEFLTLIRDNPGKRIFVHCCVGDDRTGIMIAAFRMADQGWSADEAEKGMEGFGFDFLHRRVICPRLLSYEKHFPEHLRTNPAFRDLREPKPTADPN